MNQHNYPPGRSPPSRPPPEDSVAGVQFWTPAVQNPTSTDLRQVAPTSTAKWRFNPTSGLKPTSAVRNCGPPACTTESHDSVGDEDFHLPPVPTGTPPR